MEKVLGKFSPQIYALIRIVAGLLFAQHGAQKLFGALGGDLSAGDEGGQAGEEPLPLHRVSRLRCLEHRCRAGQG